MNKTPRHHKLGWYSSYDRGLQYLLGMWGEILKKFPDAQLHIAYGWDMFDKAAATNPERMRWKHDMELAMQQRGIHHYGRLGKKELADLRKKCGILAYSTDFFEINCITALDCQKDGCVPVVMNQKDWDSEELYTALDETVYAGIKVEGNIRTDKEKYFEALTGLMGDEKEWKKLSIKGINGSQKYLWPKIAEKWAPEFAKEISMPLVSIYTPTIRKGFWNLMASNIAFQSYKNVEWIVVDDFPKDRSFEMKKACDRWGIKGKYVRGGRTDKFHFGLSSANNIAWKNMDGELLIYLQDFVLMPARGIEMYVDIYRHNPNTMIAGTDVYHFPKVKPNVDSEDWFDGELDVVGEFSWENQRNLGIGMRKSESPMELEFNYCAIPKKVIDSVGGSYEFFNDGLGFDNTELAYRALYLGKELIVDDTNVAVCLDHWEALKNSQDQLGEKRTTRLNDPRYIWMMNKIKEGKLPVKRDEKIDTFRLEYEIPDTETQDGAVVWMNNHMDEILDKWENIL
jgi:glycosyltransferase involved in cell wall biosynthesis